MVQSGPNGQIRVQFDHSGGAAAGPRPQGVQLLFPPSQWCVSSLGQVGAAPLLSFTVVCPLPRPGGCCAWLARSLRRDQRYRDFVRKAECHCLLRRAVAEAWTVRVKGNLDRVGHDSLGGTMEWYHSTVEVAALVGPFQATTGW